MATFYNRDNSAGPRSARPGQVGVAACVGHPHFVRPGPRAGSKRRSASSGEDLLRVERGFLAQMTLVALVACLAACGAEAAVGTGPDTDLTALYVGDHPISDVHVTKNILRWVAAPSNLAATPMSPDIDLSWQDNSGDEDGFQIERAVGAPDGMLSFTKIATVGADVTNYTDPGLKGPASYSYRVRAFNAAGRSGYTNIATAPGG